ncbi:MAG: Pyruvate synthase subunit PorD [candidate division TA06 bacterium ADurb.Bin417]|uniref:Pyruvate synthase subunit PorD n=1 Tax=candidate division TA06 bacterium ADurb.Bin417 TaxID=1852828 RepID=A0A1V5MJH8_UNCT6|nr:MAG: Pyruvate synthase subunit PorD [candidate division TA06 bacterium ADurb.Bin417]
MSVNINSRPGSARNNRTGSWRVDRRPKFLRQNCIACRLCLLVCPEGIITGKAKNSFETDYVYCKGCGLCAAVCPKKDIEMIPEDTETEG